MHIIRYMGHNRQCSYIVSRKKGAIMGEKVYRMMRGAGATSITVGVIALVVGIASGILLIISGAKLIAGKSKIIF